MIRRTPLSAGKIAMIGGKARIKFGPQIGARIGARFGEAGAVQ